MRSITLGQYYPARSLIHSLDPRTKVILAMLYIVCTFVCKSVTSFGLLLVSAIIIVIASRIPIKTVLSAVRPILFIMIFTAAINLFLFKGESEELLFNWKFISIYKGGVFNAVFMVIRIVTLIIGTSMFLTYTTTPIMLTDAIERLLYPLHKLFKLKVHEFAMMMTIALRFIPTFIDETDKIMAAQRSRGADFNSGSLFRRAKSLVPILIPLFISAYHKAIDLATAMECRCYRGGDGRTRMNVLRYGFKDLVVIASMTALLIALICLNSVTFVYVM